VWQEGIARYTECRVAELAAAEYKPSKEFKALPDFRPFDAVATEMMGRVNSDLESPQLDHAGRTAVYSVGAAEGLILDRARPGWRKHYFEEKFTLDPQFRPM